MLSIKKEKEKKTMLNFCFSLYILFCIETDLVSLPITQNYYFTFGKLVYKGILVHLLEEANKRILVEPRVT